MEQKIITQKKIEDLFSVKDKVILIVGTGGIGSMYAEGFALNGATIVAADLKQDMLDKVKERLAKNNLPCDTRTVDITDKASVQAMVDGVVETYGRIDVLVHTAALGSTGLACDHPEDVMRKQVEVNIIGNMFVCQVVGNVMKKQCYGKIINLGSIGGLMMHCDDAMVYNATKAATAMITKAFATELAPYRVNVNSIGPIWVRSPLLSKRPADYFIQAAKCLPLGRTTDENDLLGIGLYFASDACNFTTGQTVYVDGGWSITRIFEYDKNGPTTLPEA